MLILISPAKTLDYESPLPNTLTAESTQPLFLDNAEQLIDELRALAPQDISALMHISDKLGALNYDRYQQWQRPFTSKNAKPALLAFKGDVYTGLDAAGFSADEFEFAQKHLRILSGLYGVLQPLDLMQPYRLEMGTKFQNSRGKHLYDFWGTQITDYLNQQLLDLGSDRLINLASNEYFKAVPKRALKARVITPIFKDLKNGQYKIVSFYAKKARGLMSAYAIHHQIQDVEQLKEFNREGYIYNPTLSEGDSWVFTRDEV